MVEIDHSFHETFFGRYSWRPMERLHGSGGSAVGFPHPRTAQTHRPVGTHVLAQPARGAGLWLGQVRRCRPHRGRWRPRGRNGRRCRSACSAGVEDRHFFSVSVFLVHRGHCISDARWQSGAAGTIGNRLGSASVPPESPRRPSPVAAPALPRGAIGARHTTRARSASHPWRLRRRVTPPGGASRPAPRPSPGRCGRRTARRRRGRRARRRIQAHVRLEGSEAPPRGCCGGARGHPVGGEVAAEQPEGGRETLLQRAAMEPAPPPKAPADRPADDDHSQAEHPGQPGGPY